MQQNKDDQAPKQEPFSPAPTGNASNPSPGTDVPEGSSLLHPKAEKYLREVASPEDYPDEQDWKEADKIIEKEGKESGSKEP